MRLADQVLRRVHRDAGSDPGRQGHAGGQVEAVGVGHAGVLAGAVEREGRADPAGHEGRAAEQAGVVGEGRAVERVAVERPPAAQRVERCADRQRHGHHVRAGRAVGGVVGEAVGTGVAGRRGVREATVGVERQAAVR